jgi:hypothetical protein
MNLNETTSAGHTSYLSRPDGRIGYEAVGTGPLIVLVPGMGDLSAIPWAPGRPCAAHSAARGHGPAVGRPVLVVMGEQDPDFPDPAAEAAWIAQAMRAQVVMVPEAGHYPQSQQPEITAGAVLRFLAAVPSPA